MIKRSFADLPPRITFTSDFHELVRGDLRAGASVLLRYDPRRILRPAERYAFGDKAHQFYAHVPGDGAGEVRLVPLVSHVGVLDSPDYDVTGDGSMLVGHFVVPGNASSVAVWFTHRGPDGGEDTDDDFGRRFVFGFPGRQVMDLDAAVEASATGVRFTLGVATSTEVERVSVRFRSVGPAAAGPINVELQPGPSTASDGGLTWTLEPQAVPDGAFVRFKIYYWMGGRRFKDDDGGTYYEVDGGPPEVVPPPPPGLAAAAARWR